MRNITLRSILLVLFLIPSFAMAAVLAVFTASETFDVGMDTSSPVADDYLDVAPFKFEGTLKRLHFKNLTEEEPEFATLPDDD